MGPVWGLHDTYYTLRPYIQRLGVPILTGAEVKNQSTILFDYLTGASIHLKDVPLNKAKFAYQVAKFDAIWIRYRRYLVPGFKNGIPDALALPVDQFLKKHGLELLTFHFTFITSGLGYGQTSTVPMIAVMSAGLTPRRFGLMLEEVFYAIDYSELFTRLAKELESTTEQIYSVDIKKVQRSADGESIKITFAQHKTLYTQRCDRLINAFAPTLELLTP